MTYGQANSHGFPGVALRGVQQATMPVGPVAMPPSGVIGTHESCPAHQHAGSYGNPSPCGMLVESTMAVAGPPLLAALLGAQKCGFAALPWAPMHTGHVLAMPGSEKVLSVAPSAEGPERNAVTVHEAPRAQVPSHEDVHAVPASSVPVQHIGSITGTSETESVAASDVSLSVLVEASGRSRDSRIDWPPPQPANAHANTKSVEGLMDRWSTRRVLKFQG